MMDYALNALAPKLEVGQEALFDALRCQDSKRATRIIQRVASRTERGEAHRSRSAGHVADREREVYRVLVGGGRGSIGLSAGDNLSGPYQGGVGGR